MSEGTRVCLEQNSRSAHHFYSQNRPLIPPTQNYYRHLFGSIFSSQLWIHNQEYLVYLFHHSMLVIHYTIHKGNNSHCRQNRNDSCSWQDDIILISLYPSLYLPVIISFVLATSNAYCQTSLSFYFFLFPSNQALSYAYLSPVLQKWHSY